MRGKIVVFLGLSFLILGYLFSGLLGIQAHTDPGEMDTTAYLSTACQIRETGGILHHVQNCLSGVYREATQHPLYLLVLSPFAERNVHFFVNAKFAGYFIGFLFLLVYFFTVRNLFSDAAALLGLCLVVSAAMFLNLTTMVACESLLALFFILFWFFAAKGFENEKYWPAAGFFAGLSFLTKSIGIFTLPVFLISVLILSRVQKKSFSKKYIFGFFAVFFLISSPLLVRNVKLFHTPFYSDSTSVMWIDRWHDYYRADVKEHPPTVFSYLKTHTPTKVAATFFSGLFRRDPRMISDGLKPFAFWVRKIDLETLQGFYKRTVSWQSLWAWALFLLSLAGLWEMRKHASAVLASVSLVLFFIFVGWYSKVFPGDPPTRLLYPVLFFIYIFCSAAVLHFLKSSRWITGFAGFFSVVYLCLVLTNFNWHELNLKKSYFFRNPFVTELRWVDTHAQNGQTVMAGNFFMSYLFYFESKIKARMIVWPQVDSVDELETYARENSVNYGILDLSTVVYDLKAYKNYFEVGPHIGLRPKSDLPSPFYSVYKDPSPLCLYEIYEFREAR